MADTKGSFARKLQRLFEEVRKTDGSKYTQSEVIQGTNGVVSRVYLWKLRTGRASNPGVHIIQALADFFGVDIGYFFEEEGQDPIDKARKDDLLEEIALRSEKLDEEGKKAVLQMIDYILKSHEHGEGHEKE